MGTELYAQYGVRFYDGNITKASGAYILGTDFLEDGAPPDRSPEGYAHEDGTARSLATAKPPITSRGLGGNFAETT